MNSKLNMVVPLMLLLRNKKGYFINHTFNGRNKFVLSIYIT
jgi:hypothetical protein